MKKTITYKELLQLQAQANAYLIEKGFLILETKDGQKAYNWSDKPLTKLVHGIKNVLKQIDKLIPDYNEELETLRIDNCLADEKTGALLKEADLKTYKFSASGAKKFNTAFKELQKKEVEVHVRIQDEKVDLYQYDMFNGILVAQEKEEFDAE